MGGQGNYRLIIVWSSVYCPTFSICVTYIHDAAWSTVEFFVETCLAILRGSLNSQILFGNCQGSSLQHRTAPGWTGDDSRWKKVSRSGGVDQAPFHVPGWIPNKAKDSVRSSERSGSDGLARGHDAGTGADLG